MSVPVYDFAQANEVMKTLPTEQYYACCGKKGVYTHSRSLETWIYVCFVKQIEWAKQMKKMLKK
jgi:hypothetical protein